MSGFIILHTHFDDIGKKGALSNYLLKRIIRVYPIYWVTCFITLAGLTALHLHQGNFPSASFIIQSLFLIPQSTMPLVIVAWTLTHEIFFYALFGVLIMSPVIGSFVMTAWVFVIVGSHTLDIKYNYLTDFVTNLHNLEFLLGMGIALASRSHKYVPHSIVIAITGIIGFICVGVLNNSNLITNPTLLLLFYALCSSLIILGLVSHELKHPISIPTSLRFIGNSSYAIYLIHFFALSFTIKVLMRYLHTSLNINFVILFMCATTIGILFHFFIERIILKLIKNRMSTPKISVSIASYQ